MAIRYPFLIVITIILIIVAIFFFKKKKNTYTTGTKVANTSYIKNTEYYKQKEKEYRLISNILKGVCLFSIIISSLLLARINKVQVLEENEYKRDIFLCMDVSGSVDELNYEIAKNLQDIVKSLKGERFGISIFNSSSVLLVPLTNDYEYVLDTLKKIEKSFEGIGSNINDDKYLEKLYYITSGTLEGDGGSLIGDGLASCVFSFPNLEEDKERTRILILTTDNDLAGKPLLTIEEAAAISKKKNVKIFGVATDTTTSKNEKTFKQATETTGGAYFKQGESSIKDITKKIEKESKSLIKEDNKQYQIDIPTIPFVILLISIAILIYLDSKVIS